MSDEEDEGGGIPEWVVTFGDMMSLLLTFFIMLVSMSEIKNEERFQAMVESLRRQFGHDSAAESFAPGPQRPRNAVLEKLATMGRARRTDTHQGGDRVQAPVGDQPRVTAIRPGEQTAVGGPLFFSEGSADLDDDARRQLARTATILSGKPQKIEIRGHAARQPADRAAGPDGSWTLAFARCRTVLGQLVAEGIDPDRIRLSVAGTSEPLYGGEDPRQLERNARVEVYLLTEMPHAQEVVPGNNLLAPEPESY